MTTKCLLDEAPEIGASEQEHENFMKKKRKLKVRVCVSVIHQYETEIEADSLKDLKSQVDRLSRYSLREVSETEIVELFDEKGEDITGLIQPSGIIL